MGLQPSAEMHHEFLMYYTAHKDPRKFAQRVQLMQATGIDTESREVVNFRLRSCAHRGDFTKAQELFDDMLRRSVKPNEITYQQLIRAYVNGMQLEALFEKLAQTERWDAKLLTWAALHPIVVYYRRAKNPTALQLLIEFVQRSFGLAPNLAVCNELMQAYCADDNDELGATETLEIMQRARVSPSVATFNILAKAKAERGNFHAIRQLIDVTMPGCRVMPNVETYASLARAYANCGSLEGAQRVLEDYLAACNASGADRANVPASRLDGVSLIFAEVIRAHLTVGDLAAALHVLHHDMVHANVSPTVHAVQPIVMYYVVYGELEAAKSLVEHVARQYRLVSPALFHPILSNLAASQSPDRIRQILSVSMPVLGCKPDSMSFMYLAKAYAREGSLLEAKDVLLRDMRAANIVPTAYHFNNILEVCNSSKNVNLSPAVLADIMPTLGLSPDPGTFYALVNSALAAKDLEALRKILFETMPRAGIKPLLRHINHYLHELSLVEPVEKLLETIESMRNAGVQPDSGTFTCLIRAYARADDLEQAHRVLFELMPLSGIDPELPAYVALGQAIARRGDTQEARNILIELPRKAGLMPDAECYTALLHAHYETRQYETVIEIIGTEILGKQPALFSRRVLEIFRESLASLPQGDYQPPFVSAIENYIADTPALADHDRRFVPFSSSPVRSIRSVPW